MKKFFDIVVDNNTGRPIAGVIVRVRSQAGLGVPASGLASIYKDASGTPTAIAGQVTTAPGGYYEFYAAAGFYTIDFIVGGDILRTENDIDMTSAVDQAAASSASAAAAAASATASAASATTASAAQTASAASAAQALAFANATNNFFASTADALSKGVQATASLVGGSGGTNGTFALAFSGGAGSGAAGVFVVAGGAVTQITITSKGVGYTSAPTISFAASSGLTGASATAVIGTRTNDGDYFLVKGASTIYAALYKNVAGVATAQGLSLATDAAIPSVVIGGTKNLFDATAITGAYEIYSDGTLSPQADSIVSDFMPVKGMVSITASGLQSNPGAVRYGAFYAQNQTTVLGVVTIPDGQNSVTATVPATAWYFRVSPRQRYAAANSLAAVQVEQGSVATEYETYRARVRLVSGAPVDETRLTITGDVNLFDKRFFLSGQEVYNNGTLSPQVDSVISNPMWCRGSTYLTVQGLQPNPGSVRYYRFLAADLATVVGTGGVADGDNAKTIVVPATAYWFQISLRQRYAAANAFNAVQVEDGAGASPYQAFTARLLTVNDIPVKIRGASSTGVPWAGRNYILFGDSITETENVDAGRRLYGSGYRANWPDYAIPLLGPQRVYSYARAGAAFNSLPASNFQKFAYQVSTAVSDALVTPDVIVVALGTNDWGNSTASGGGSVVLGDYTSAMSTAYGSLDVNVAMQAMRKGLYQLQNQWPLAKKFISLPIQRADFTPQAMQSFIDDLAKMARRYGFEVIDGFGQSGIVNDFEVVSGAGQYLSDGLHPNPAGQQKLGELIASRIRARLLG